MSQEEIGRGVAEQDSFFLFYLLLLHFSRKSPGITERLLVEIVPGAEHLSSINYHGNMDSLENLQWGYSYRYHYRLFLRGK